MTSWTEKKQFVCTPVGVGPMLLKGHPTSTTLSESDFESESECEFESDNLNIWIWSDHSSDCDNMWYDEYDTASKLKIESEFGSESESNWVVSLKLNVSLTEYLWWSDCGSTIFENQSSIWLVAHWLSYWIMCQCKCFTTWIACGWLLILINVVFEIWAVFCGSRMIVKCLTSELATAES